jgi:hypothetical protein
VICHGKRLTGYVPHNKLYSTKLASEGMLCSSRTPDCTSQLGCLYGGLKCCPESHSTSAILSTCLAMFCTSTTLTAFPSPSPPCHFLCTSHIPSIACLPHLPLPPQIPVCLRKHTYDCVVVYLTALCPFGHMCCLDRGFECLPLTRLPFWRYHLNRVILYFPKSPKALQSDMSYFFIRAPFENSSRERTDNRINSVPKLYSLELGTFRVGLLFCYLQKCWNHVIMILSSCWDASPWPRPKGRPRALRPPRKPTAALSNPTNCRKLGLAPITLMFRHAVY